MFLRNFVCLGIFLLACNAINITNTRYRMNYHIQPPAGWMNDPNGLSYFNNQYHIFFQYNPDSSNPGAAHWGHVVSPDLVHWSYLSIALYPDQPYDKDGCWSGSAVVDNGQLTLIYAGNVNDPFKQTVNIATSTDGVNFTKYSGNPVIAYPPFDGSKNFKDPKVWQNNGTWYASICNPTTTGLPRTVLYRSTDLKTWLYINALAVSNGSQNVGNIWDDPNFFSLNGKSVLFASATGIERDDASFANQQQTIYTIGNFDYNTNVFTHGDFYELDVGHDFFAAQYFQDPKGRIIVVGWMYGGGGDLDPITEQPDGWAGALTIPRQVQKVILSRNNMEKDFREVDLGNTTTEVNLHVFIDRSSVEVFVNNGLGTMTSRFYADPAPSVEFFVESQDGVPGTANVHLQAFYLTSIY